MLAPTYGRGLKWYRRLLMCAVSHSTCSGPSDEAVALIRLDDDDEFPQMVNVLLVLSAGPEMCWCITHECTAEQTLAHFLSISERTNTQRTIKLLRPESWTKDGTETHCASCELFQSNNTSCLLHCYRKFVFPSAFASCRYVTFPQLFFSFWNSL